MTGADQPTAEADERPVLVERSLAQILAFYRPGSHDWTWAEEYADVMQHERTEAIWKRVSAEGVGFLDHVSPVLLGSDDRVWDGHHRICIAIAMDLPTLMVEVADRLPNVLGPASQPTTEASVRGWVVVDKKTGALDWDGELHPTHDAAYLALRAYGDTVEATEERRTFYDVLPVLDALPAPQPAADTEREVQVRALREAAEVYGPGQLTFMGSAKEYTRAWLHARADHIERGEEA